MKKISLPLIALWLFCQSSTSHAQTNMRGWHANGQTWLVWEDTLPYPETYRIYKASEEFTDISAAEQTGRIFEKDWTAHKLKLVWDSTMTWTIPDGSGGAYTLSDNEALFVYTPHEATPEYFAVVRDGDSVIETQNSVGPITQTIDQVTCHLQLSDNLDDAAFRVFAHWIDGQGNQDTGRADYPVMANEHFNGIGMMFRIWEYPEGERPELVPLVTALHGGGGWFGNFKPMHDGIYKSYLAQAMIFCPDDGLDIKKPDRVRIQKSYWLGFWEDYNRFLLPEEQPVPDTGMVINYTMRRVIWELDWLIENEAIDPKRISLMGGSMGGRGANYLARAYPSHFAAWLSLSPGIQPQSNDPFTGSAEQDLTTNLPSSPGVMTVMDLHSPLSSTVRDIPFGKLVGGRNDPSLAALTPDMIQAYGNLDGAGFGSHIYWDERGHVYTEGSYWSGSFRQTAQALTAYRSDRSFPAFFNDDQDFDMPGRQPELGIGEPEEGDPWGTWGGYYNWDAETLVDSASIWKATVYLNNSGNYPVDIPGFDSSRADISIRRPQRFSPTKNRSVSWELKRLSDSRVLQSGWQMVGNDGVVTIPDVTIYKEKCQLLVGLVPTFISITESCSVQIYPNPVSSFATIEFHMPRSGRMKIALHDVAGHLVEIVLNEFRRAGSNIVIWDSGNHPAGVYFCSFTVGSEILRKKIILSR